MNNVVDFNDGNKTIKLGRYEDNKSKLGFVSIFRLVIKEYLINKLILFMQRQGNKSARDSNQWQNKNRKQAGHFQIRAKKVNRPNYLFIQCLK